MSERSTDALVHQLARDLEPVEPIPRLRSAALLAIALWAGAVVASWLLGAPRPAFAGGAHALDAGSGAVLTGLVFAAAGGLLAGLASAVPGRERAARNGAALVAGGLALVIASVGIATGLGGEALRVPGGSGLPCILRAVVLGVAPAAVAIVFLLRAFARQRRMGAAAAGIGAACLGGIAVHTSCVIAADPVHAGIAHCAAPIAIAVVIAVTVSMRASRHAAD